MGNDPLWYKDAIIYEVHVRGFCDSNGVGFGNFKGLTEKLDYLHDLGVNTLWLLPFYPSPFKDDGYDISDYNDVHPDYGTLADFRKFIREAHRRNLKIITELVINHTSDQHPWFQAARHPARRSATSMSGQTRTKNFQRPAASSPTRKNPIGLGTKRPMPITGTVFFATSPI